MKFLNRYTEYNESIKHLLKPKDMDDVMKSIEDLEPDEKLEKMYNNEILDMFSKDDIRKIVYDIDPNERYPAIDYYELKNYFTEDELKKIFMDMDADVILSSVLKDNDIETVKYILDNYKLYGNDTRFAIRLHLPRIKNTKDLEYLLNNEQVVKFLNRHQKYVIEKYRLDLHKDEQTIYEKKLIDIIKKLNYFQSEQDKSIMIGEYDKKIYFNYNIQNKSLIFHSDNLGAWMNFNDTDFTCKNKYDLYGKYIDLIIKGILESYFNIEINQISSARNEESFLKN